MEQNDDDTKRIKYNMDERDDGVRYKRKQGLAHQLLNHVTKEMGQGEVKYFCGETRVSNKAMQKVFEDCGYELDRIEKGYYTHPGENAYKYILRL